MNDKKLIVFDDNARPVYLHLDPVVDLLIQNGNKLARDFRWGENRTGFYCFFQKPLDFGLIERSFHIPDFIKLYPQDDAIECDKSWVTIKGGISPRK